MHLVASLTIRQPLHDAYFGTAIKSNPVETATSKAHTMQGAGFILDEPPASTEAFDVDAELNDEPAPAPAKPLTSSQTSRWINYLDDQFRSLSRGVARRHIPNSSMSTLPNFIHQSRTILHIILAAPPAGTGNPSRAEQLLNLTDAQDVITGYDLSTKTARKELFAWLDELDRGWETVLLARGWPHPSSQSDTSPYLSYPVSNTQKIRLVSLATHIKDLIGNAVQEGPKLADLDDSDSDVDSMEEDATPPSQIESVLHTDLEAHRIFQRTFKLLESV